MVDHIKVVELKPTPKSTAVEFARRLLEQCESGEVTEIVAIKIKPDGRFSTGTTYLEDTARTVGYLNIAVSDLIHAFVIDEE